MNVMTRHATQRGGSVLLAALALLLLLPASATAGVPNEMNVQGSLFTSGGVVADGQYTIRFSLHTASTMGTEVWFEQLADVQVTGGLFSVILGGGTALPPDDFVTNLKLWLEIQIIMGPGIPSMETPLPRQPLTTVAYAFDAYSSRELACTGCVSETELDFLVATQSELDTVAGTITPHVTSVHGLDGGTIDTAIIVTGSVTSADFVCNPAGCIGTADLDFDVATQAELQAVIDSIPDFTGWDTNASDDVTTTTMHSGDVAGIYSDLQLQNGVVEATHLLASDFTSWDQK